MNKFFTSLLLGVLTCACVCARAQAPQKMTYQSVVRDVNNTLATDRSVSARVWILQGGADGTAVYIETQTASTNANGLMTLVIGEGTVVSGSLTNIDWANGPYFLKAEVDPAGGTSYTQVTVQELLSVPYALYAEQSGDGFSGDYNDLVNTPDIPTVPTNVSAFANDVGYLTGYTEQQVLSISHDTLFLTGGSFVKLPAGFDGDYNSLTNTPNLSAVATSGNYSDLSGTPTIPTVPTNVSAFTNDAGYLTDYTEQQVLGVSHDTLFLTGGSFVKLPAGFDGDYNSLTNTPNLSAVATSGSYNDLSGTPTIPTMPTNVSAFVNDAGYITSFTEQQVLSISHDTLFLTGGSFVKFPAGFDGDYNSLTSKPNLSAVATSGEYSDLENLPQIPQVPAEVSAFTNDAGYLTQETVQDAVTIPTNVSSYANDAGYLTAETVQGTVTLPENVSAFTNDAGYIISEQVPAQVNADWNATEGAAHIVNKPEIPSTANNATLTVQQNETVLGTFSADASSDQTLNVTVPTATSQLGNNAGYITADSLPTSVSAFANDAGYLTAAQCGDTSLCEMVDLITSLQTQIGEVQTAISQMSVLLDSLEVVKFQCGTSSVFDYDSNLYHTVQIGNQCWMRENMRTTHYADGTEIPLGTVLSYQAFRYIPNNDINLLPTYGYYYNWAAVMHDAPSSSSNPSEAQGICPAGWHVPSNAEWTQLKDFVGGQVQYMCDSNSTAIAKALASTTGWDASDELCAVGHSLSENDATGFSAYPNGYYFNNPHFLGTMAYFWSSTQTNDERAYGFCLNAGLSNVFDDYILERFYGLGIRCLRDVMGANALLPTVSTSAVGGITAITVTCGGEVASDGGAEVTARGVCWSTSPNPTLADSHTSNGTGTGLFTSSITGLSPSTTYYVRAYATNSHGTGYGSQQSFTTNNLSLPSVIIDSVSDITFTTALCGSEVTDDGGAPVTARGVCWSYSAIPTLADSHTTDGDGMGSFVSSITGLRHGTTYYVRAYATNSQGTMYSPFQSFTTPTMSLPTVVTASVSDITYTSAVCGGEVTAEGDAPVTERGVCWTTMGYPMVDDNHIAVGSGLGSFSATLTGLDNGTSYHVRAYAISSAGIVYGGLVPFTTTALSLPTVVTSSVSDITNNTAVCGGEVTADGGSPVTVRGVCWSTSPYPTVNDAHTTDDAGIGSFTSNLTGLAPNTTYYVRAYATNSQGTRYGLTEVFTTPTLSLPIVTTFSVSDITYTTAVCGGEVTSEGDAPVTERGICWTTNGYPTVNDNHIAVGSGLGSFSVTLTGLDTATSYNVRAYAISSAGTVYGELRLFTTETPSAITLPTVNTVSVSDITCTTAVCGGEVTDDGGSPVTARGVCWSRYSTTPTVADNHTTDGAGTGTFTSLLTGLTQNATYYVRAYAINSQGTMYGLTKSFTTPALSLPTVNTVSISNISYTTAVCSGEVTSEGDAPVTERGICWTTSGYPTVDDNRVAVGSGLGSFSATLTGLATSTSYHIRAYAISSAGVVYGNVGFFTTLAPSLPTVITDSVSNITHTAAICGGEVTSDGGLEVTARGICWNSTGAPTLSDNHTIDGAGLGSFTSNIPDLVPGGKYYVRAYATNSMGTAYGPHQYFTTPALSLPTVTTASVSDITATTAVCGGEVTDEGEAPVTERGICWTSYGYPTLDDNHIAVGSGLGSFSVTLTGLDTGTIYYVIAYAISSAGTVYGDMVQFTTDDPDGKPCPNAPTMTDFDGNTYNTVLIGDQCWMKENLRTTHFADGTSIPLGSEISYAVAYRYVPNNDPTTVPAYGYLYNWSAVMKDELSSEANPSEVWGICPTGWHVPSIAEWRQLRDYLRSKFKYWCGGNSNNIAKALASTTGWNSSADYCDVGNDFSSNNSSGFNALPAGYYSNSNTSLNFGWDASFWSSTQDTAFSDYVQTFNLMYYIQEESIQNKNKTTGHSVRCILNTDGENADLPTVTTDSVRDITYTTATCGGDVTDDGGLAVTARGICWGTTPNPTVSGLHTTDGSGTGSFTSSISGLSLGTTYYVRAYATNSLGTMYGQQVTFTTLSQLPTVITKPVTSISTTAAVSSGDVTDDGTSAVTARGICWGTSPNPTLNSTHSTEGTGTGVFVTILTDLTPNTTYYVRAYATNSVGTAYGEQMSFTTSGTFVCGTSTITDIDNNIYNTVQIGNQCWMKENLRTTHYPDGTEIPAGNTDDWDFWNDYTRCAPNGDVNNVPTYGYHYSWTALMNGASSSDANPSGVQGICPEGWHVPSDAEWGQLVDFVIGQGKYTYASCHNANAIAFAMAATSGWHETNEWCAPGYSLITNNATGFSALPAGYTPASVFNFGAYFWTSTQTSDYDAYIYTIENDKFQVTKRSQTTYYANSLRCLSDVLGEGPVLPTVTTDTVFVLSPTRATCESGVTSDGGDSVTARGVCWSTSPNPTLNDGHTTENVGIGVFSTDISNLAAGTTYYVRAYATNSVGTSYGQQLTFTTVPASDYCAGITIPYSNDFRNADDNVCWTVVDANGDGNTFRFHPDLGYVEYDENQYYFAPTDADEYLISPTFTFTGNPTVVRYQNHNFSSHYRAIYEVFAYGPDTILLVQPDTFQTNFWITHRLDVSNLNGDYAIAFHCMNEMDMNDIAFTNFSVYEPSLPDVYTRSHLVLSDFSARVDADLYSDGGADIEVGFCWSTSPNPTLNDNHIVSHNLIYNYFFNDTLTNLIPNTHYYVRAYATNFVGTSYGGQLEFTTTDLSLNGVPCPGMPTVTDVDNNTYNTVWIAGMCWMKENLRTTRYADNTLINLGGNNVSTTTAYRYYPNGNSNNVSTYGYLYNSAAVRHGAGSSDAIPSGVQGICPNGWHLPSSSEWEQLRSYLIGYSQEYACYDANSSYWQGNIAKSLASKTGWVSYNSTEMESCSPAHNPSSNNATNFTALPAGYRIAYVPYNVQYMEFGAVASFWSCTSYGTDFWATMGLNAYFSDAYIEGADARDGKSVRCIRD